MIRLRFRLAGQIAVAGLALAWISSPAVAQSQNELRLENQRLQTQVADLEVELETAREEIASLKAEIERLQRLLDARGQAAPAAPPAAAAPEEEVTIDESRPEASPRALLAAIIAGYGEETAELEMGAQAGDAARTGYLRRLNRWVAKINRQYRVPIEWHVRIVDPAVRVGRAYRLRLRAVDPKTDVQLGDAFDAVLSSSLVSRLREHEQRFGLDDVMILKGVLTPAVLVNTERTEAGAFDNPRFVGPFVEFDFAVQAQTILPAPEEDEREKAAEAEAPPVDR
jgi:hypothetical protein